MRLALIFGEGELALRHRHACARILHALCTQAKKGKEAESIIFLFSAVHLCYFCVLIETNEWANEFWKWVLLRIFIFVQMSLKKTFK